jgi:cell division protein FtsW (lipid II flippase)
VGLISRPVELGLLVFPVLVLFAGLGQLALVRTGAATPGQLSAGLLFAGALGVAHILISARYRWSDQTVLPLAAVLAALGLIVITRLQPDLALRQSMWLAIGLALLSATLWLLPSIDWLKRYKYTCALLGLGLVLTTFGFGVDPNGSGARLWLGAGGVYFQPSEILKVLLVVFFAGYLDDYHELLAFGGPRLGPLRLPPLPYLMPLLFMLGVSLALLFLQRDLGAALLFFGVFLALLYAASGRLSLTLMGLAGFAAAAYLAYRLFSHVQLRVAVWLDPWSQADTGGYQVIQALMALAAGGLIGTGLGYGSPGNVPAAHTDFVIAAIGEELGFLGAFGVAALYALLVYRAFRVALETRNTFAALLAAGLGSVIGIQSLIILGGTLRLFPLTGITLPLISYGGSSVIANCVMLGLLLRISDEAGRLRVAR